MTDRHESTGATGAMRKMAVYLGLVEDDHRYQDKYDSYEQYEEYDSYEEYEEYKDFIQDDERHAPDDAIFTALYFGAEQTRLPHEPTYDVERGLQRFSAWLDDRTRTSAAAATRSRRRSLVQPIDLARITTLHPRTYNEARMIGEYCREGIPVIMNLTEMTDSDAKRLIDFAAGLIFGLHGRIERVTKKVFLLSPANVEVAAEEENLGGDGVHKGTG